MSKRNSIVFCLVGIVAIYFVFGNISNVEATNFEGDESYWTNYCSGYISDAGKRAQCTEYAAYIQKKVNSSKAEADGMNSSISEVKADLSNLKAVSEEYGNKIIAAENEVTIINDSLLVMEESIIQVEVVIVEKEEKIDKRKATIRNRMVEMQGKISTNQFIDYIMGAADLVDLVQRSNSVESFTKNDKEQIVLLNVEKKELEYEKAEKERIEETLVLQQANLVSKQAELQSLKNANDAMVAATENKVAEMLKVQNEANAAANTLAQLKPQFTISNGNADVTPVEPSSGWIAPIQNSWISRGVNNAGHRGVDYAAGAGTPIIAPAAGYVVYASNAYPNTGSLGNMIGTPAGGGNSVRFMFSVNGETFAMNLHHMQNNVPAMAYNATGVPVAQGTVLGYVGSSGNSSGPHAHIELFKLSGNVSQAMATWYSTGDWQSSCGWGLYTPAYGSYGTRLDPRAYLG